MTRTPSTPWKALATAERRSAHPDRAVVALERAVATAVDRFGGLDVLVWNGGGPQPGGALDNARSKLARKGCDWIVANDVSPASGVMGGDRNTVHLVTASGVESWPTQTKDEVAQALVARIVSALSGT